MNKAAVLLNTTQPAVSKSIAELERTVGVRLLDRNAQGVEPTAYGRALLDGGTAVFDDLLPRARCTECSIGLPQRAVEIGLASHAIAAACKVRSRASAWAFFAASPRLAIAASFRNGWPASLRRAAL